MSDDRFPSFATIRRSVRMLARGRPATIPCPTPGCSGTLSVDGGEFRCENCDGT